MHPKVVSLASEDKRQPLGLSLLMHATYHLVITNPHNSTVSLEL